MGSQKLKLVLQNNGKHGKLKKQVQALMKCVLLVEVMEAGKTQIVNVVQYM
jgi:hypothetical protein